MAPYFRNGAWHTDVPYKIGGRRRRHRKRIGTRKKEAEEAEAQIRTQIAAGTFNPGGDTSRASMPFAKFVEDEFLPWSHAEHSATHHKQQVRICTQLLIPFFGDLLLEDVPTKRIEDYKRLRHKAKFQGPGKPDKRRKIKPATVNRELACLKVIFRKATDWRRIEHSPAAGVKPFKEVPAPPRLLEEWEVVAILEELPQHLKAPIAAVAYAGLRKQELFYLRWEDVSFRTNQIKVVSRDEHPTKNNKTRQIPLHPHLADYLRQHVRRLDSPYVFPNRAGIPYDNII